MQVARSTAGVEDEEKDSDEEEIGEENNKVWCEKGGRKRRKLCECLYIFLLVEFFIVSPTTSNTSYGSEKETSSCMLYWMHIPTKRS